MLFSKFLFHVDNSHFPGHHVFESFFAEVEYCYFKGGIFNCVLNVAISFRAFGAVNLSVRLAQEIEAAARNNLRNTCLDDPDDISDALSGMPEVDMEIQNELHRTGHK